VICLSPTLHTRNRKGCTYSGLKLFVGSCGVIRIKAAVWVKEIHDAWLPNWEDIIYTRFAVEIVLYATYTKWIKVLYLIRPLDTSSRAEVSEKIADCNPPRGTVGSTAKASDQVHSCYAATLASDL